MNDEANREIREESFHIFTMLCLCLPIFLDSFAIVCTGLYVFCSSLLSYQGVKRMFSSGRMMTSKSFSEILRLHHLISLNGNG